MLMPFMQGFGTGGGLIVAIGAQNAFVLAQALRRNHHVAVALLCCLFDVLLISAGVAGVGAAVGGAPALRVGMAWAAAAFLGWYGARAALAALHGGGCLEVESGERTLRSAVLFTLAVTFLNPHAYLDTVVLVGGLSASFEGAARWAFAVGAMSASCIWFLGLGLGGARLAPVFRRPVSWRVLDGLVALTMWSIAAGQVRFALAGA